MTIEYIRYAIAADQAKEFEQAYARASAALDGSPHCLGYDLAVCDEDATQYVLRIEWDSAEGHMQGFRRSPQFREFLPHIQPYIKQILEMRHYSLTPVARRAR
jgi:quinol monooxygenase YgiN